MPLDAQDRLLASTFIGLNGAITGIVSCGYQTWCQVLDRLAVERVDLGTCLKELANPAIGTDLQRMRCPTDILLPMALNGLV